MISLNSGSNVYLKLRPEENDEELCRSGPGVQNTMSNALIKTALCPLSQVYVFHHFLNKQTLKCSKAAMY